MRDVAALKKQQRRINNRQVKDRLPTKTSSTASYVARVLHVQLTRCLAEPCGAIEGELRSATAVSRFFNARPPYLPYLRICLQCDVKLLSDAVMYPGIAPLLSLILIQYISWFGCEALDESLGGFEGDKEAAKPWQTPKKQAPCGGCLVALLNY